MNRHLLLLFSLFCLVVGESQTWAMSSSAGSPGSHNESPQAQPCPCGQSFDHIWERRTGDAFRMLLCLLFHLLCLFQHSATSLWVCRPNFVTLSAAVKAHNLDAKHPFYSQIYDAEGTGHAIILWCALVLDIGFWKPFQRACHKLHRRSVYPGIRQIFPNLSVSHCPEFSNLTSGDKNLLTMICEIRVQCIKLHLMVNKYYILSNFITIRRFLNTF